MDKDKEYRQLAMSLLGKGTSNLEIDRIISVLNAWEKQISPEAFPIFKYVVSFFRFYSTEKVVNAFQLLNETEQYLSKKEALFLPLRHKDRMETSLPLFTTLGLVLPIDVNRTKMNISSTVLSDIYEKKTQYASADRLIKNKSGNISIKCKLTETIGDLNSTICRLSEEKSKLENKRKNTILQLRNKEKNVSNKNIAKIKKDLEYIKKQIKECESKKKGVLNEYLQSYVSLIQVQNIIIIDDFLCTGTSIKGFMEENLVLLQSLKDVQFLFLFIEATSEGIRNIKDFIKSNNLTNVKIIYGDESINVDSKIALSEFDLNTFHTEECRITSQFALQESDYQCRTAIASFVNSPNSNCRFLNSKGNGSWEPLFEREIRKEVDINHEVLNDVSTIYGG